MLNNKYHYSAEVFMNDSHMRHDGNNLYEVAAVFCDATENTTHACHLLDNTTGEILAYANNEKIGLEYCVDELIPTILCYLVEVTTEEYLKKGEK